MPSVITDKLGHPVEVDLIRDLFEAEEGSIDQYYGRIGNGKTYNATADIWDDLNRGISVYANWELQWPGHDEREDLGRLFLNWITFSKRFYKYRKENFHYYKIDDEWAKKQPRILEDGTHIYPYRDFMDWFAERTDCKIYADEGHILFDSYQTTKFSMKKRTAILHTRHFNRTLCIISQRPTAVHVSARANVNRFLKCEKVMSWPFLIFRKTEYQDMASETVDETKPVRSKWYFADKRILNAYNTKYLRGGIPRSQNVYVDAYDLSFGERTYSLLIALGRAVGLGIFVPALKRRDENTAPEAPELPAPADILPPFLPTQEQLLKNAEEQRRAKEKRDRERRKHFAQLARAKKEAKVPEDTTGSLFESENPPF